MNQQIARVDVRQSPTSSLFALAMVRLGQLTFLRLAVVVLLLLSAHAGAVALDMVALLNASTLGLLMFTGAAVLLTAQLTVNTQHLHGRFTMDADLSGVQKSHTTPVPRIGGISVVTGFFVLLAACFGLQDTVPGLAQIAVSLGCLLLCGLFAFASGTLEDVTKRVSVGTRLAATVLSGLLAAVCLDAYTTRLDVPLLDDVMVYPLVAMLVSAVAVGGIANAINIVDGFNGLAGGTLVVIGLGFALLAGSVNDPLLVVMSLGLVAVALGFLGVNYPSGRLFLGDGGAYLLGFWLGEIAVLTLARHPEVSCWTVLALLAYPVVEVLVSVVRRKMAKTSPGAPDRGHLHQQIQSMIKHVLFARADMVLPVVNAQVSPFVWGLNAVFVAMALLATVNFAAGVVAFFLAALLYVCAYTVVKRFNVQATARSGAVTSGLLEVRVDGNARSATIARSQAASMHEADFSSANDAPSVQQELITGSAPESGQATSTPRSVARRRSA